MVPRSTTRRDIGDHLSDDTDVFSQVSGMKGYWAVRVHLAARRSPVLALLVLALSLAVACRGRSEPGPAPAATNPVPAPTTPVSAPIPTATSTGLGGMSRASDPAGDVLDPEGHPPPRGSVAADLRTVTVERHGDGSLTVTVEVAGAIPPRADSLLWSAEVDGGQRYSVSAQLTGGELSAGIYDHHLDVQHPLGAAEVTGAAVTLRVPDDALDGIDGSFRWWALTQLDGAYEDRTEPVRFSTGSGR